MDGAACRELSEGDIYHVIQHVFLPPKLPQTGDDPQALGYERSLLTTTSDALRRFGSFVETESKSAVDEAYYAVRCLRDLRDDFGFIDQDGLKQAMYDLAQDGTFTAFCGFMRPYPLNKLQGASVSYM